MTLMPLNSGRVRSYSRTDFDRRCTGCMITLPQTVPWFTWLPTPFSRCLSLSFSCTCKLELTDLKIVTFLSELPHSHSFYRSLIPSCFTQSAIWLRASLCKSHFQAVCISFLLFQLHAPSFIVLLEETMKGKVSFNHSTNMRAIRKEDRPWRTSYYSSKLCTSRINSPAVCLANITSAPVCFWRLWLVGYSGGPREPRDVCVGRWGWG